MTEQQIIEGCLRKDRQCEYELFRLYGGLLLTVCRRYARNRMEAEDWLQESFLRIFSRIHQYEAKGSLEGWLRRVTVSVVLKKIKKLSFKREVFVEVDEMQVASPPPVLSTLHEEELLALIAALPDGYRVVFNLFAIEGYSHKEIGELLQIEEATSRSQLAKARKVLQEKIVALHQVPEMPEVQAGKVALTNISPI